jgi:seryl-tRNA synthetase
VPRRVNVRFKRDGTYEFVHTFNVTWPTARALLSLIDNVQDEGGAVAVPDALQRFGAPSKIGVTD